nr:glycosyltransferase family 4 protein [uncultured Brumimicrobium sp.]
MKTKVTNIISEVDKVISFEWIIERINSYQFELSFILINSRNSHLGKFLNDNGISVYHLEAQTKKEMFRAVFQCRKLLKGLQPDVVHCHLIKANLIGLTAAKLAGVKRRIYTRHHSDYHFVYFPKAVKWDKYCNSLSTKIVAITDNVSQILIERENVSKNKVIKIWHGFNISSFIHYDKQKSRALKQKYNPEQCTPVIGVISRFTHWKGVQYIIPAYNEFIKKHPNSLMLFFNAKGDFVETLNQQLKEQIPFKNYRKIEFEQDITNLYSIFDFFVHVPISNSVEAFGQTYIETMAAGVPLIATKSGIGNEILKNEENALIVDYKNSDEIYEAMMRIMHEEKLKKKLIKTGLDTVKKDFSIDKMIEKLEELYR